MGLVGQRRLRLSLAYAISIAVALWLVFPPVWMVLTSFKPGKDVVAIPPVWIFHPTLEHYLNVFQRSDLLRITTNSVIVSFSSTALTLVLGTLAGYSISRFHIGGRALLYSTLVFRVLPPVVLALPYFVMFSRIGINDTLVGLVIAYVSLLLPTTIWLMIAFFNDVPREIEEAALVDGCSRLGTLFRIAVPLVRPGLAVTTLYNFMGAWNHFFFGLILSAEKARTLPVEAANYVGQYAVEWGPVSAIGTLIIIIPVVIVFATQRHLVRGLTFGAIK
jgi:multiple sugar transport system permease protein